MSGALNITAEDLKTIIATAVATAVQEVRKPAPPTEQELSALQMAQEHRALTAADVLAKQENERALQRMCTHTHSLREGGGTHCVWVREEDPRSPGYILCQLNQCIVRPGEFDKKGLPFQKHLKAIYDTNLFNRLFQDCGPTGLMG